MFNISEGCIQKALKVVVYGPEGIGKSTFASQFPQPLFIDTEGSTNYMNVRRLEKPSSWQMLKQEIDYVKSNTGLCKTLIIDTVDWAEQLCVESICAEHHKKGIEDFGYGNGYVFVKEEFGRFLNLLSDLIEKGINVVLTAHAQIKKFEQPDELGAYDRYELKLGKKTNSQTSPLVKEWADMVLFANYKTVSVAVDNKGNKHKAQGGKRVMYTSHHPCWDAKNRQGLPEEMEFDYSGIAHLLVSNVEPQQKIAQETEHKQEGTAPFQLNDNPESQIHTTEQLVSTEEGDWTGIPRALTDLMKHSNVTPRQVQDVVASKGYYPADTLICNYEPGFIQGVLIEAWNEVIKAMNLPF